MTQRIRIFSSALKAKVYANKNNGSFLRLGHKSAGQILEDFRHGKINLITMRGDFATHGINLNVGVATVEYDDDDYDDATRAQIESRLHRHNAQKTETATMSIKDFAKRIGMPMQDIPSPDEQKSMTDPFVQERMRHVVDHIGQGALDVLNDFTLGNIVRMLMRDDLMHESIVVAARDRIWKLSHELDAANTKIAELQTKLDEHNGLIADAIERHG